jgi:hypothetical protein
MNAFLDTVMSKTKGVNKNCKAPGSILDQMKEALYSRISIVRRSRSTFLDRDYEI